MTTADNFLRRTNGSVNEYLFFTVEDLELTYQNDPVDTRPLPGNQKADVDGSSGNNFVFPLGSYAINIRINGTFVNIDSGEYPSLDNTTTQSYVFEDGTSNSSKDQTGKYVRDTVVDFCADQSNSNFSDHKFGWVNWGSSDDTTIFGNNYRLWEGLVTRLNIREFAGEDNQYRYNMSFGVGVQL